ncbi:hypothetical protein SLA2020_396800 [Shorea laevis]
MILSPSFSPEEALKPMKPMQGTSVVEQETTESELKCRNMKLTSTWVARIDSNFDSKSHLSWKESLKLRIMTNHPQSRLSSFSR